MSRLPFRHPAADTSLDSPDPAPCSSLSTPAGFAAPVEMLSDRSAQAIAQAMAEVAAQVLRDPLLKRRLSDRLYELLQQDLRIQQDRVGRYGRRS
jgi:cell pole-organizing protein PopZ